MADRRREADDFEDDRPRRAEPRGRATPKVVMLVVLAIGLLVLTALAGLAVVGFGLAAVLARPRLPAPPQAAAAAPPAEAQPGVTAAAPSPGAADPAADLYAPTTEGVLPADAHATSPLRPRKADAVYKVANLRVERGGPSPFPRLVVDYERTRDGAAGGTLSLVLRPAGKRDESVRLGGLNDRVGKIDIGFRAGFPFADDLPALANCECYLTLTVQDYGGGFRPTFKVSNSSVAGDVKGGVTLARAWTADEAARLRKSPPKWPVANVNGGVGQDTPFAGDPAVGPPAFRYAVAGRPLLGLEWNVWAWEGVPCLAHVYPIYDREMPQNGIMPGVRREVAKPGYAIGGLVVKSGKLTHAVQVVYFKLTDDRSLDPSDSYTSDWLGDTAIAGDAETKLAGDGRLVIGVTLRAGAVLSAISLVVQGPARK